MRVAIVEPFFSGSHKQWCEGFQKHSSHEVKLFTLPGVYWKWRMHAAAIQLVDQVKAWSPDIVIASDFLDVASFRGLYKDPATKVVTYFHENQITYPWSETDPDLDLKRDNRYGWINFTSALASDKCFFNSAYHKRSFLNELPKFLSQFPEKVDCSKLEKKCSVLPLGLDLWHSIGNKQNIATIVWNHRWEYDKNPGLFYRILAQVNDLEWNLMLLGERFENVPKDFQQLQIDFRDRIIENEFVERDDYRKILSSAHINLVTSNQDFFGGSVVESIHAGVYPILPNRLAYPEHVPSECLFNSEEEAVSMLREAILNFQTLPSLSSFVEKYNWQNCIQSYDSALEI